MSGKIFKSMFFTTMGVVAICFLMVFSILFDYFEGQFFSELESEAEYISYAINSEEPYFPENFQSNNNRVTIISPDGNVLADSKRDVAELENHGDRKEVKAAFEKGVGKSSRYSRTFMERTLYYAKKLDNGNVLRVSATQKSVFVILLGLMHPMLVVIAVALVISLLLSYKVSSSIVKPINSLDIDNPEKSIVYEELEPLIEKMSIQKRTINLQIEEARKSREEFRLICENMNEGFLVIDKSARILTYNSATLKLLDIDEIRENTDISILAIDKAEYLSEAVKSALSGEKAENTVKINGCIYNIIANPVNENGRVIGAVLVIIDITEGAKREQLRREFTSNVSHELKTPLTSISGFAEMLKSGGVSEETVIDFSTSIYDEAQRLINLVIDIIKISELDEGTATLENEKVDLYALSKSVIERLKPIADKECVLMELTGESACVLGVGKILDEMIYNLCDNALKYNKPGGKVEVSVTSADEKVTVEVSDNGIGIPQSAQARVFERFYRVDKSRSKSAGGTGLGLAIVKHGAMYHNARIGLESREGIGTRVSLEFDNANKA